jgi:hypothetical protein
MHYAKWKEVDLMGLWNQQNCTTLNPLSFFCANFDAAAAEALPRHTAQDALGRTA